MSFTMSQASVPVFEISLNALTGVLEKAAAHAAAKKIDQSVLVSWRLAPDMFALGRQVQVVCDQAKNGSARLAEVEPPKFEDTETTLEQLGKELQDAGLHQNARRQGDRCFFHHLSAGTKQGSDERLRLSQSFHAAELLFSSYSGLRDCQEFWCRFGEAGFSRLNSAETKLDESKRKPAPG